MKRAEKGITLIALIITIIVMLILVGVTVTSALNGGLINTAKNAVGGTKAEQEGENKLDEGMINTNGDWITIEEYTGTVNFEAIIADALANEEEWLQKATIAGQDTETNTDIGIGTDGKVVNLDLWNYTYINGELRTEEFATEEYGIEQLTGYVLNGLEWIEEDNWYNPYQHVGYIGEIENGKIIGKVPAYIKSGTDTEFIEVKSMICTFYNNQNLSTAPTIPSSVTNMNYTFWGCTRLSTAPTIPSSVTNMQSTFEDCTNLSTVPTIPSSVTNMSATFYGCTNLTTVPTIPSSVTNMWSTFSGCTNLSTAPTIPSSVTNMNATFGGCTSLTTAPTIPSSVTDMYATFAGCTGLSTAPTIPSSVTNMSGTFGGCTSLTGNITINANPSSYFGCFSSASTADTADLTVKGKSSLLSEIVSTKSRNSNIHI